MYTKRQRKSRLPRKRAEAQNGGRGGGREPSAQQRTAGSGRFWLRSPIVLHARWVGGAEPWCVVTTADGQVRQVPPSMAVWELVLALKGWEAGRER